MSSYPFGSSLTGSGIQGRTQFGNEFSRAPLQGRSHQGIQVRHLPVLEHRVVDDQFVPGSTLLAYLNADHWAVAPISRHLGVAGGLLLDKADYPRAALLEALLRYVEEDLDSRERDQPERASEASRYGYLAD